MPRDRVALTLTALTAALHLAVANRYDLFRDELYFIVCGRNPALGYADQPPFVPLLAAGAYGLGGETWIVRLPAVAAAAALVWFTVAFIRLLRGGDAAAWIGGSAAALAPMFAGITATLNTTTFEPLAWTVVAYGLARAAIRDDRRSLIWCGVAAGCALEAKYTLPLWLVSLAFALVLFPERRLLRLRELWLGLAIAVVIALPSLIWQAAHGFPFADLVRNAHLKDIAVSPPAFILNQIFVFAFFTPIWLSGLIAPFVMRDLRTVRFISIAFAVAALVTIAAHGKDYYLAAAYPSLFAIGGVRIERLVRNSIVRTGYVVTAGAVALAATPLALPILPPDKIAAYQTGLHLQPEHQERGDEGDVLPPQFADMFGWHDFVRQVGTAYDALPAVQRARTSILVDNYGEAAALELYGAPYHLPLPLSGHNQYFYWGLRGQDPNNLIVVHARPKLLQRYCASATELGTTQLRFARSFENGRTIAYCRGLQPRLSTIWPKFRVLI